MTQNNQQEPRNQAPEDNGRVHYETLVHLFSLGSQEFYNRFTAMVLSHTILLSGLIIGSELFHDPNFDKCTKIVASMVAFIGIFLCIIWGCLLRQSLAAQHFYRDEAKKLEDDLPFKIFSSSGWQALGGRFGSIEVLSSLVITLFIILYIVLFLFIVLV